MTIEQVDQMDSPDGEQFVDEHYGQVESATTTPNVTYVNETGIVDHELSEMLSRRRVFGEVASVIEKWSQSLSGGGAQPTPDLFNRGTFADKKDTFATMAQCAWAVENDDILSTLADVIEGLMWQKCRFELFDGDQQDVWNQWAADVNLDDMLRQMGREAFKVSQFYVGLWWEKKTYGVQEDLVTDTIAEFEREREKREYDEKKKTRDRFIAANQGQPGFVAPPEIPAVEEQEKQRGNRTRRKKFEVRVPTAMTIFEPTKIVPVGSLMFGRERFAYVAGLGEDQSFTQAMAGEIVDRTVLQLVERKYTPTEADKQMCADLGVDYNRLWLLKEDAVFRHSLTKASYERFGPIRLKSVLPILEMKQHLRASDRATLIGATNFIVVITKGSDRLPAKNAEIQNLQEQARIIARMPLLVGDHRLKVEIVAPAIDNTLQQSRWEVLDSRLVFKALQAYSPVVQGGNSSGTGVSEMSRVIARGLESRRHMIVRSLEAKIFAKILERNEGIIDESPSLAFTPRKITLDFNADIIGQVLKLRDRGDVSRETALEEMDFDQDVEVLRRARERAQYDHIFSSVTPHGSPLANPYAAQPGQQPGQPGDQPGSNVGPAGQPRTEGGRPPGVKEDEKRNPAGQGEKRR